MLCIVKNLFHGTWPNPIVCLHSDIPLFVYILSKWRRNTGVEEYKRSEQVKDIDNRVPLTDAAHWVIFLCWRHTRQHGPLVLSPAFIVLLLLLPIYSWYLPFPVCTGIPSGGLKSVFSSGEAGEYKYTLEECLDEEKPGKSDLRRKGWRDWRKTVLWKSWWLLDLYIQLISFFYLSDPFEHLQVCEHFCLLTLQVSTHGLCKTETSSLDPLTPRFCPAFLFCHQYFYLLPPYWSG